MLKLTSVPSAPATSTPRRARRASTTPVDPAADVGIVRQVRIACDPRHRLAVAIGAVLGAIVPLSVYVVAHTDLDVAGALASGHLDAARYPALALVLGGLAYSATTVYQWGRLALGPWYKALGFAVLTEGVMTLSHQTWLAVIALVTLCGINAIATGVTLVRGARLRDAA